MFLLGRAAPHWQAQRACSSWGELRSPIIRVAQRSPGESTRIAQRGARSRNGGALAQCAGGCRYLIGRALFLRLSANTRGHAARRTRAGPSKAAPGARRVAGGRAHGAGAGPYGGCVWPASTRAPTEAVWTPHPPRRWGVARCRCGAHGASERTVQMRVSVAVPVAARRDSGRRRAPAGGACTSGPDARSLFPMWSARLWNRPHDAVPYSGHE